MRTSIVTISYNQVTHLPQCLASIEAQNTDGDLEHVVVDPGSTDGSRDVLADYARRTGATLVLEPDDGPGDGLNKGFSRATGDVLYYLNADDELAPGAVATMLGWHRTSEADVIYGDGWVVDHAGHPVRHVRSDLFTATRFARGVGVVLQQATSFKRRVWDAGVRFNAHNRLCWDTEFLCDALQAGHTFQRRSGDVGYFRIYPTSITGSQQHSGSGYRRVHRDLERRVLPSPGARALCRLSTPASRVVKRLSARSAGPTPSFPGRAEP